MIELVVYHFYGIIGYHGLVIYLYLNRVYLIAVLNGYNFEREQEDKTGRFQRSILI